MPDNDQGKRAAPRRAAAPVAVSVTEKPTTGGAKGKTGRKTLWWPWIVGLLVVYALFRSGSATQPTTVNAQEVMSSAPVTDAAAAPESIDPAVVRLGVEHAGIALGAEALGGAMVYSVNCFASLGRRFEMGQLDRCGAFDATVRGAPMDDGGAAGDASNFFSTDAAAARYRAAAIKGGVDDVAATDRLEKLRVLVAGEPLTIRRVAVRIAPPRKENVSDAGTDTDEHVSATPDAEEVGNETAASHGDNSDF